MTILVFLKKISLKCLTGDDVTNPSAGVLTKAG